VQPAKAKRVKISWIWLILNSTQRESIAAVRSYLIKLRVRSVALQQRERVRSCHFSVNAIPMVYPLLSMMPSLAHAKFPFENPDKAS
jgi:hypothetical protein